MISVEFDSDVQLKELRDFHAVDLFQVIDRNRIRLREYLPWLDTNTELQHTERFIRLTKDLNRRGLALSLGIFVKNEIAGLVGFNRIDRENKTGFIGYWLDASREGQGLMSKSVAALLDFGFVELNLHRMDLRCAPENARSRRVAKRLGFEKEGLLRDTEWLYDHFVDHEVYGLLKTEWSAKKKAFAESL